MDIVKCFFHVDLDAFFASVEQIVHPEYRNKPVIISGNPHQRRNVVSTASYEARKFGVHSAMPSYKAYELCPQGIFVEPDMALYHEYSERVMNILKDFSPDVLQLSIDEACLDMTGTERLFGKPEEAAEKIKNRIKEETGLTISVGIATNSYLAKICSEIKKPDGLFQIPPGQEENFMSTLPLKDIWGVGEKTLKRLNGCGFNTINDIKSHSKEFLKSIVGEAGSSFLYNVCRGIEPENFRSKPKSRSLSTETTFTFDLTDINTIETELLELSSQVMQRLLHSNITSMTVQLKIRYEDFTTVNVQQTFETPLLCTDDLYTKILSLFNRKYESGRGIRLLGVGVQNYVSVNQIVQPELFESENKKKQAVEKAILQLETKHPEIKISKARLMPKIKTIAFLAFILFFSDSLSYTQNIKDPVRPDTKETTQEGAASITDEAKLPPKEKPGHTTLLGFNFGNDSNNTVVFLADGFWNMKLTDTFSSTFGYGHEFTSSFSAPVFEQEVDLSVWFLLNNHFYVQGAFADKFNKNTFAVGYYSDDTLKEIKASNRNIIFPEDYSLTEISRSIGGGDNQAPGISVSLSDDKWKFDAAIRYDMLTSFDKTYYGKNAVTNLKIPVQNYLSGSIFIMPSSGIAEHITAVYIEASDGSYTDEANRSYKKLSSNQYLILPVKNQIILSSDATASKRNGVNPCVLIEFDSDASSFISPSLGTFGTSSTPGSGYLGSIQKFFASSQKNTVDVSLYSYSKKISHLSVPDKTGTFTDGYFITLNSKTLLLAQHTTGFSPFQALYRYDGGTSSISDVQVASSSTEIKSQIYTASISDIFNTVKADFFNSKRTYIDVYNPDFTLSDKDTSGNKLSYSSPEINFPFADRNPGIYLGYQSSNDDCVMIKSVSQSSRVEIGTKAIPGTVTVFKNGIIDSSAKYNSETGEITLSSGIADSDKIYITWYEDSSTYDTGMIAGAAGFKYDFLDTLSGDIAASSRWAINPELKYAEYKKTASGYATVSTGIKWNEEKLSISNTTGLTFAADNVTGNYRINGMDNSVPETAYLIKDASKNLPSEFCPFINPRPQSADSIKELFNTYNCSVTSRSGELDSAISGYAVPVSYNFNDHTDPQSGSVLWASNTIITSASKNLLSNASKFNIALKLSDQFISLANDSNVETKIYLQLGVSSDEDFKIEDKGNIPTWKIFDSSISAQYNDVASPVSVSNLSWQTVSVILRNQDRALISNNYNIRLIITASKKSANASFNYGTIYAGPYETVTQGIFADADSKYTISTENLKQNNPDASKFNKNKNYAQYVNWNLENTTNLKDSKITVYKYFDEVDLSSYKNINLYFNYSVSQTGLAVPAGLTPSETPFIFILDRDSPDAHSTGSRALELKIGTDEIKNIINHDSNISGTTKAMHKLEINRIDRTVYIDGRQIKDFLLYVNPNIVPTRIKFEIESAVKTTDNSSTLLYPNGSFGIDEIYLSECSSRFILQNITKTSFKHNGDVLKTAKGFSLIADPSIIANGEVDGNFYTSENFENKAGFSGNIDANVTLATIRLNTNAGRASETKHTLTSSGHGIATTKPLFNILSFSENFLQNKDDATVSKADSASLNFSSYKVPLTLKGQTKIDSDNWSVTQTVNDSLAFNIGQKYNYDLVIDANAYQKKNPFGSTVAKIKTDNYFDSWIESSKLQFSTGDADAARRNINASIKNTVKFPFAGFTPHLDFAEEGTYSSSTQNIFSESTSFSSSFPFKIKNQNFSFGYNKSSSLVKNTFKGGNYGTDITLLYSSMAEKNWFFYAGPFYDLFSQDLALKVLNTIPNAEKQSQLELDTVAQSASYNAQYDFSWRRPLSATSFDLFVPTIATLAVARDISTAENIADTYQIKATTGYTSINVFSKDGFIPLLKWCESDEYNLSLQAALKIPRAEPENLKQLYNLYLQANFYKTKSDVFKTGLQFSFQDQYNWNSKATVQFKRDSHFTPLLEIVKLFNTDFDYSGLKITRTDALNITASSSLAETTNAKVRQRQTLDYSHEIEVYLLKQFALTASIDTSFTHTRDEILSLGFTAGLGGKLNF